MKRETFRKEHCAGLEVIPMVNNTIVLPFDEDTSDELLDNKVAYNATVNAYIEAHPELFPDTIGDG